MDHVTIITIEVILLIINVFIFFTLNVFRTKKLAEKEAQLDEERKWHTIAYEDILTGLKNRMAYMEYANHIERSADKNDSTYLIMIDIDDFKAINDTYGHHIGDRTLQKAAEIFFDVFRERDYSIYRIGGDEFAIIAIGITEKILFDKIAKLRDNHICGQINFKCSVGWAKVNFANKNAMEEALIIADRAMYEDKQKNKHLAQ